jgi:hypothetical protein
MNLLFDRKYDSHCTSISGVNLLSGLAEPVALQRCVVVGGEIGKGLPGSSWPTRMAVGPPGAALLSPSG